MSHPVEGSNPWGLDYAKGNVKKQAGTDYTPAFSLSETAYLKSPTGAFDRQVSIVEAEYDRRRESWRYRVRELATGVVLGGWVSEEELRDG